MPEQKSAPPANSLYHAVEQNWDGHEYEKFVEKTRHLFGESSDEYFVATQVMKSQQNAVLHGGGGAYPEQAWAVPGRNLGAGGFGSVDQLDVPTLGMSFAVKSLKKAVSSAGPSPGEAMVAIHYSGIFVFSAWMDVRTRRCC